MNTKGRNKGQLILVAGFLVAIAIIGVAMTLSGVFFTQNVEESGLSQFESSATSQQASADFAAKRSFDLTNLLSERRGMTTDELNTTLINYLRNYTSTTQNVSQLQAVVNVSLNKSTVNRSWLAGRQKPGYLPGFNYTISNTTTNTTTVQGRDPADVVFVLDTTASMGFDYDYNTFWNSQSERYSDVDGGYNGVYASDTFSEAEVLLSWQPSASGYYEDPTNRCTRSFNSDLSFQNDDLNEEQCEWLYVQGDDPGGESQYDVDIGDIVYDTNDGESGEALQNRTQTNCGWWGCYSWIEWQVDKPSGQEWVAESDLEDRDVRFRYWIPKKMYYAKQATKTAIGALNGTPSGLATRADRVGLVEFDVNQIQSDDARVLQTNGQSMLNVSGNKNDLNDTVDSIYDNYGSTYIAAGIEKARGILSNDPGDSDHIVVLSDGQNSDLDCPSSCNGNSDENQETRDQADLAAADNITVHSVALGASADASLMKDLKRNNGSFENGSADELVDIFDEIIGDIKNSTNNTTTKTITEPTQSEAVEKIYELGMNVTHFNNGGSVSINLTSTSYDPALGLNVTEVAWKLTVNNSGPSYKIDLSSETNSSINKEKVINEPINGSEYIEFDVMGDEVRNSTGDISFDLRPDVIKDQYPVSFAIENNNKSANGTFRFEFRPSGGNFSSYNTGSGISGLCPSPGPCGYQNSGNSTYSTAKIRYAKITISYNSAEGDYQNTFEINSD